MSTRLSGPAEVVRVYKKLTPRPKELLMNSSNRRYVREGRIGLWDAKQKRTKDRYLFLFNDVLLVTKPEPGAFWLKIFISLRTSLRVEDVPDSVTPHKVEFRIYAPKKTLIMFARSQEEKLQWIRDIRAGIEGEGQKGEFQVTPFDKPAVPVAAPNPQRDSFASEYTRESYNQSTRESYISPSKPPAAAPTQQQQQPVTFGSEIGRIEIPGFVSKRRQQQQQQPPQSQSPVIDIPDYEEVDESDAPTVPAGRGNFYMMGGDEDVVDIGTLSPLPVPSHTPIVQQQPQQQQSSFDYYGQQNQPQSPAPNSQLDPYGLSGQSDFFSVRPQQTPPAAATQPFDPFGLSSGGVSSSSVLQPLPYGGGAAQPQTQTPVAAVAPAAQPRQAAYSALYSLSSEAPQASQPAAVSYGVQPTSASLYGAQPTSGSQLSGLYGAQPTSQSPLYGAQPTSQSPLYGAQPTGGSQLGGLYGAQPTQNPLYGAQPTGGSQLGGLYGAQPTGAYSPSSPYGAQPTGYSTTAPYGSAGPTGYQQTSPYGQPTTTSQQQPQVPPFPSTYGSGTGGSLI